MRRKKEKSDIERLKKSLDEKPLSLDEKKVLLILLCYEELNGAGLVVSIGDIKRVGFINEIETWDEDKFVDMARKIRGNKAECFDFLYGKQEVMN